MEIAVPSLSLEGFITDIRKTADLIMAHYFASDYSQSNTFYGKITSLAYQVQLHNNNPDRLKTEIETKLTAYLERHFDSASVVVSIGEGTSGSLFRYDIQFDAVVIKEDQSYSVGKLIEVQNGKIKNIINRFQQGE